MNQKRDIITSRTAQDVERKYGKRIVDNEKEAESQSRDLASLNIKLKDLTEKINLINNQITTINQECSSINTAINEINDECEDLNETIEDINDICENMETEINGLNSQLDSLSTLVDSINEDRHTHSNKNLLDDLTQSDINKWNSYGTYKLLAENVVINQEIDGIDDYNFILLQLQNVNRYIPCFKYENTNTYKGINVGQDQNLNVIMEEIALEVQNEIVTSINSTNSILKLIGIF